MSTANDIGKIVGQIITSVIGTIFTGTKKQYKKVGKDVTFYRDKYKDLPDYVLVEKMEILPDSLEKVAIGSLLKERGY
ncbi:MAG: hypothetical protein IJ747_07180 [Lachnospiraceae bacterium]|nr:hypothetical protein [Lachnospiraceae bacterium]